MLLISLFIAVLQADIPAACNPKTEINGTWIFHIGSVVDPMFNCSSINTGNYAVSENITVNISIEGDGSHNVYLNGSRVGWWSSMWVEGFDVFVNQDNTGMPMHYQAYFNFTTSGRKSVTNCSRTLGGWARYDVVLPREFRCFWGEKLNGVKNGNGVNESNAVYTRTEEERYVNNRRVRKKYIKPFQVEPAESSPSAKNIALPSSLDWSNYTGQNYVSPVYDQGACGSCFAFGTLSALEARLLIYSKGAVKASLSQQDIVSCSFYSQGCDGGYVEEVGYWAKDHGVVDNKCYPYTGKQSACKLCNSPTYYYTANVSYVGGYHGACTEQLMLEALQDGPIPVGINANAAEFDNPKPGTIIDSKSTGELDHEVLLVGYGVENGVNFWKIKNSWGTKWGDSGYARVRRGKNTLGIESDAEIINPVVDSVAIDRNSVTAGRNSAFVEME